MICPNSDLQQSAQGVSTSDKAAADWCPHACSKVHGLHYVRSCHAEVHTSNPSSVMLSSGTNSPALLTSTCSGRLLDANSCAKFCTDLQGSKQACDKVYVPRILLQSQQK